MTKRHVRISKRKLEAARELLGTTTAAETIDVAFDEILMWVERRRWLIENRDLNWGERLDEYHQLPKGRIFAIENPEPVAPDLLPRPSR